MAPEAIPPGWSRLVVTLGALWLSACGPAATAPPAAHRQLPSPVLQATFVTAWGGVPATSLFSHPSGVAVDGAGALYKV